MPTSPAPKKFVVVAYDRNEAYPIEIPEVTSVLQAMSYARQQGWVKEGQNAIAYPVVQPSTKRDSHPAGAGIECFRKAAEFAAEGRKPPPPRSKP